MAYYPSLPWLRINDFLAEVGTAENEQEFIRLVFQRIETLVPSDIYCVFGVYDPKGMLCASKTILESKKYTDYFNNYYWRLHPDISREKGVNTKTVDWNRYRDSEYVTDFLTPQHIRYSLGVHFNKIAGYEGIIALNRSKTSPPFTEKEQRIMEILQPHLSNFYRIFMKPTQLDSELDRIINQVPSHAFDCTRLTNRENEIAGLVCRGLSTKEISAMLVISEFTVYRHLNNIFTKMKVSSRIELVAKLLEINRKNIVSL